MSGPGPGSDDRSPTITDVARAAGVSKKTVSRILNQSPLVSAGMRERVERTIRALGYRPNSEARALAFSRVRQVAGARRAAAGAADARTRS